MCQPRLYPILPEEIYIRSHHMYLGILLLLIIENAMFVSAVVMVGKLAAAGLVEIFLETIGWYWSVGELTFGSSSV